MAATAIATNYVIDVTDQTFTTEVLERSKTTPVVVDFWAAWCGPCRMLGPILENLANEFQGDFVLAKVDVDRNPQTAMQYHVQGIPAVKAFRDGQMTGEFTGALPEPQVRKFIEGLVPSEVDLLAKQGFEWEVNNQLAMAETNYREALGKKSDHYPAKVGLGRVLLNQGEVEEATKILNGIPAGTKERIVAEALLAGAQFQKHAVGHNEADLRAKISTNPNDVASRYALANLLAGRQQFVEALEEFLTVIRFDRKYSDDGARKAMLVIFTIIGEDRQVVKDFRRKLANALF
jgi:putative thioredoxin